MFETISVRKRKTTQPENAVFSILIPSWNNLEYLQLCIESIHQNSHFTHQIIVHINEGRDGTLDWLESRNDIDYSHSEKNIGVCYALNISSSLATTDYIVYINDDMFVCPDWDLELLNEIKNTGHNYFFFSSTAIEPEPTNNPCVIVKDYGKDIRAFQKEKLTNEFSSLPMSDWQGATWPPNVLHKDLWNLVGGYSTEFSPGMYSDPDFSMKLWQAGVRLFKGVSKSRVYHFGSKSTARVIKNRGYYTFITKWGFTSSTFTRYFLRSGSMFNGPLTDPVLSLTLKWKNFFKRWRASFFDR
jgi:glycosyltransferase involved in cell wall biosynthesis